MKNKILLFLLLGLFMIPIGCAKQVMEWQDPNYPIDTRTQSYHENMILRSEETPTYQEEIPTEELKKYFTEMNKFSTTGAERHFASISTRTQRDPNATPDTTGGIILFESFEPDSTVWSSEPAGYDNDTWDEESVYLDISGWVTRNYEISRKEFLHKEWKRNLGQGIIIAVIVSGYIALFASIFADWLVKKEEPWALITTGTPIIYGSGSDKWSDYDSTN